VRSWVPTIDSASTPLPPLPLVVIPIRTLLLSPQPGRATHPERGPRPLLANNRRPPRAHRRMRPQRALQQGPDPRPWLHVPPGRPSGSPTRGPVPLPHGARRAEPGSWSATNRTICRPEIGTDSSVLVPGMSSVQAHPPLGRLTDVAGEPIRDRRDDEPTSRCIRPCQLLPVRPQKATGRATQRARAGAGRAAGSATPGFSRDRRTSRLAWRVSRETRQVSEGQRPTAGAESDIRIGWREGASLDRRALRSSLSRTACYRRRLRTDVRRDVGALVVAAAHLITKAFVGASAGTGGVRRPVVCRRRRCRVGRDRTGSGRWNVSGTPR
jgi:hypothetical protein